MDIELDNVHVNLIEDRPPGYFWWKRIYFKAITNGFCL
jgi:hypothetical protein